MQTSPRRNNRKRWSVLLLSAVVLVAIGPIGTAQSSLPDREAPSHPAPLRIGALYPLSGSQSPGGREEYHGAQIAAQLVNEVGGVNGRPISFVSTDVPSADAAPDAVNRLKGDGVKVVMGSYGSTISLPASRQAQYDDLIYWESGAVATMVTERGFPNVFRTVTTGQSLGRAAGRYVATVIAPKLHLRPAQMRTAIVYADDVYGSSVGMSMASESVLAGLHRVGVLKYDPYHYRMADLVGALKRLRPDAVLVAGYVADAISFRRETLRQRVTPAVMIGTSSSFCMAAFGKPLGRDAVGLFASDKPDAAFNPAALTPAARVLRARAIAAYRTRFHTGMTAPALAGFVSGWVLFHDVLPGAHSTEPAAIRRAALALDLPFGSQVNGAGIRFAGPNAPDAGQNLRAISVIWQWQSPGKAAIVYPRNYAVAPVRFVPLPGWKR